MTRGGPIGLDSEKRHAILRQHEAVNLHSDRLQLMVEAKPGTLLDARLIMLMRGELADLFECLREHFAFEEQGGYMREVIEVRPGLERRAAELGEQHALILDELEILLGEAHISTDVESIKAGAARLLELIREHEAAEVSLIQGAFLEDLGTGD